MFDEKKKESEEKQVVTVDDELAEAEKRVEELKKKKAEQAEQEKRNKSLTRKSDAEPVQKAIDELEAEKIFYNEKIKAANDAYKQTVKDANSELQAKEKRVDTLLQDFCEKYPEGFHYTYKSPDGKVTREYSYYNNRFEILSDFDRIAKAVEDIFRDDFFKF